MVLVGPRPPQDDAVPQRRHRLRHLRHDPQSGSNHQGASMVLDASRDAIAAATRSNVSIYGVDPRGLTDLGDEAIEVGAFPDDTSLGIGQGSLQNELRLAQDSLRTLSEETGGFAVVNRNDFDGVRSHPAGQQFVLRARLLSARRQAGAGAQDRRPHDAPRAHHPGAQGLRHAEKDNAPAVNAKDIRTPEVRDAIESPIPVSGLTMHVFAAPFKGTAPTPPCSWASNCAAGISSSIPTPRSCSRTWPTTPTARFAAGPPTR